MSSKTRIEKTRVIAYVDGFNVYYGLRNACHDFDHSRLANGGSPADCLGRSLYWLDIEAVVLGQLKASEECVRIKYFSAPRGVPKFVDVPDKSRYLQSNARQSTYLDALITRPKIEVVLGWYSEKEPHLCDGCGHSWPHFEEKVTDVNIATHMLQDAYEDRFDTAFVISADADLVPPVEAVTGLGKRVIVALAPGRKRAKHLREVASEVRSIKIKYLLSRRLPNLIERPGLTSLSCPARWAVPGEWIWRWPSPVPYYRALSSK